MYYEYCTSKDATISLQHTYVRLKKYPEQVPTIVVNFLPTVVHERPPVDVSHGSKGGRGIKESEHITRRHHLRKLSFRTADEPLSNVYHVPT